MARSRGGPAKTRRPADSEIAAMGKVLAAIEPLSSAARQRVLWWASGRVEEMPVARNAVAPAVPNDMPLFGGDEAEIRWPVPPPAEGGRDVAGMPLEFGGDGPLRIHLPSDADGETAA